MIQFYFLSIFFNVLAGYIIISGGEDGASEARDKLSLLPIRDETFKLVLGILTLVTALLKLLSPVDIPIVGDLIPALAGFAAGFVLVFEYYKGKAIEGEDDVRGSFGAMLIRNKKIIGFIAIAAAGLHFLLPRALFL